MVLEITEDKKVHAINTVDGYMILEAKAIVLAMGCRERTRGAISIPAPAPPASLLPALPSGMSTWRAIWWANG